jgi:hypothetical protein
MRAVEVGKGLRRIRSTIAARIRLRSSGSPTRGGSNDGASTVISTLNPLRNITWLARHKATIVKNRSQLCDISHLAQITYNTKSPLASGRREIRN